MPTRPTFFAAALLAAFGSCAMAQSPATETQTPRTRAQVRAELVQAQRDGSLLSAVDSYDPLRWALGKPQPGRAVPASDTRAAEPAAPLAQSLPAQPR